MTRAASLASLASPEVLSVDSSNNIGINSTTPDAKLDVVGIISATSFYGDGANLTNVLSGGLSGTPDITVNNVVGAAATFTGVLTYEDVANVDSLGIITARSGVHFGTAAAGTLVSGDGTGIGIGTDGPGSKVDIASGDLEFSNKANSSALQTIQFSDGTQGRGKIQYAHNGDSMAFHTYSAERLRITSGGVLGVNTTTSFDTSAPLSIYNGLSGSDHTMLEIVADTNETSRIVFSEKHDTNKGSIRYAHGTGGDELSFHAGTLHTEQVSIGNSATRFKNTGLIEQETTNFVNTRLSTSGRVSLKNGNVARFTNDETGPTSVNFIDVHSELAVGETVSFTIIIRPAGLGYINAVFIDSVSIPVSDTQLNWQGGSAPSSGSADGYDVYTFQIIKTGGNTDDYLVLAGTPTNYT